MGPGVAVPRGGVAAEVEKFDAALPEDFAVGFFFDDGGLGVAAGAFVGFLDEVAEGLDVFFVHGAPGEIEGTSARTAQCTIRLCKQLRELFNSHAGIAYQATEQAAIEFVMVGDG